MAFLKPQNPIKKGEDFIYPLTTEDQVMALDGSRISTKYIKVDLNTEDDTQNDIQLKDADTLGGIPANQYASKNTVEANYHYFNNFKEQAINDIDLLEETTVKKVDMESYALKTEIDEIKKSLLQIGSYYTTSTNTNPASVLGFGTWSLVDKQFAFYKSESNVEAFLYDTTQCQSGNINFYRNGHTIQAKIKIVTAVALTAANVLLGTIDYQQLGVSRIAFSNELIGLGDGIAGYTTAALNSTTGELTHYYGVKNLAATVPSGSYIYFNFSLSIPHEYMLDSACDKFIWKRIA